jgi:DNA-binding CsgD family transcriptional regulator
LLEEALALHRATRDWIGAGMRLAELGIAADETDHPSVAAARYRESLQCFWADRDGMMVHIALIGLAALAAAHGHPEEAARLLGAVDAVRQRTGAAVLRHFAPTCRKAETLARVRLGESLYETAIADGMRLALPDAVAAGVAFADVLAADPRADLAAQPFGLSAREVDILRLVVAGKTNPEIADRLFITYRTVTTHLTHIYAKLGVANRTEAVALAVQQAIV